LETKVDKLKSQLKKLENAKPVDELTVEDVYEMNPELRERVHQLIKDDHWAVSDENLEKKAASAAAKDTENSNENVKEKLNYL
jgi:hypothetical protein